MKRRFFTTHIANQIYSVLEQEVDEEGNVLRDRFWCAVRSLPDSCPQRWNDDPSIDTPIIINPAADGYTKTCSGKAKKFILELGGEYRVD